MNEFAKRIKQLDLSQVKESDYKQQFAACIVLTQDHKILLQQRPLNWRTFPGMIATFGGHIEGDETPIQAIVRELHEELGAKVDSSDLITLGVITEEVTSHTELVHLYFWHDTHSTITGCYEGEAKYFDSIEEALEHPKLMDDVCWALNECCDRGLLINPSK